MQQSPSNPDTAGLESDRRALSGGCPILRHRRRVGEGQDSRTVAGSIRPPPLLRKDGAPVQNAVTNRETERNLQKIKGIARFCQTIQTRVTRTENRSSACYADQGN